LAVGGAGIVIPADARQGAAAPYRPPRGNGTRGRRRAPGLLTVAGGWVRVARGGGGIVSAAEAEKGALRPLNPG